MPCLVSWLRRRKTLNLILIISFHAAGTPFWMAPELLRGDSLNTPASDVYSFGITLYEVYSRSDPYKGEDPKEVLEAVTDRHANPKKRPLVPGACPAWVGALMTDCICEDPSDRPQFEEIDKRLKRATAEIVEPDQNDSMFRRDPRERKLSLHDIFPPHIADALEEGKPIEPEHHDSCTVFFCDIAGYTKLSSMLHATKVANMLDRLYTKFDKIASRFDVYPLETIGDCYIAVTNLVKEQSENHVELMAKFSLGVVKAAKNTLVDAESPELGYVSIRVGFHTGPLVADVVGTRNPKFCILGDTVNTASRMESTSSVGQIQCSERSAEMIQQQCPEIALKPRGSIPIKGKGEMFTYVSYACDSFLVVSRLHLTRFCFSSSVGPR